jgi:hypothetical protein
MIDTSLNGSVINPLAAQIKQGQFAARLIKAALQIPTLGRSRPGDPY